MKKISLITTTLILTYALFCCNEPCSVSTESAINIHFIAEKNDLVLNKLIFKLTATGLDRPDTFPDSSIYKRALNVSQIKLPLSPNVDQCSYILFFDSIPVIIIHKDTTIIYHSFTDTIQFKYARQLKLLSPECGFIMEYRIDSIKSTIHGIDSIRISQPVINTGNEENIKIYI